MLFTGTLAWIALANSKPVGGYSNDSVVMVAVPAGLGVFGAIVYVLLPFISKALVSGKVHTAGFNLLDAIVLTLLLLRKTKKSNGRPCSCSVHLLLARKPRYRQSCWTRILCCAPTCLVCSSVLLSERIRYCILYIVYRRFCVPRRYRFLRAHGAAGRHRVGIESSVSIRRRAVHDHNKCLCPPCRNSDLLRHLASVAVSVH